MTAMSRFDILGLVAFGLFLVGCSSSPLSPTGVGGIGAVGKRGTGGTTGGVSGGTAGRMAGGGGAAGPGGASGWAGASGGGGLLGWAGAPGLGGVAGTHGGYAGFAGASASASGTGGSPVDASVPDPWSYGGRPITKIDVKRCPPYYGCDVCTLTLSDSADAAVPNNDYYLPATNCASPSADAGTGAPSSLVEASAAPVYCDLTTPDGGAAAVTEYVLLPNGGAPDQNGFWSAYCQLLPGPAIGSPDGCQLSLSNEFCVSDCLACP